MIIKYSNNLVLQVKIINMGDNFSFLMTITKRLIVCSDK
jgi:hypothetical protein